MSEEDKRLFEKFSKVVSSSLDEQSAIQFFSELKKDEYSRLIEIFQNNDFPNIKNETKNKLLLILNKLNRAS